MPISAHPRVPPRRFRQRAGTWRAYASRLLILPAAIAAPILGAVSTRFVAGAETPQAASVPVDTRAAEVKPTAAGLEFFEKHVRPLLARHCLECHSARGSLAPKGGLALDSRAGWTAGGESGPAIVPGDPQGSLLIQAVRYDGYEMPPQGKLSPQEIAVFERWVKLGAPDPRTDQVASVAAPTAEFDLRQARDFWALKPPRAHRPPSTRDSAWPTSDVDRFILAELERAGLSPAPDAEPATWLRRVTFDLIGLPPSPDELAAFLADPSAEVRSRVIDRLLESPQFGVHWGRHWLDVARYADSNGGDFNAKYPNAWRYRNYVIDSFHRDKPYDEFIVEQLAGDLLPVDSEHRRAERLVATTFLTIGPKMLSERDKEKLALDVVDEQIDTVGKALLGLTLGCARCHDHKFDPIPTADYYALAGIFRSTVVLEGESQQYVSAWKETPLPMTPEHAALVAEHKRRLDEAQARLDQAKQSQAAQAADGSEQKPATKSERIAELEKQLAELKKQAPPPTPLAMAAREATQVDDCRICIRGEVAIRGPKVPRGFLRVVGGAKTTIADPSQSGRLELARWIARPENPLTARVMVNRVWGHLFGEGLVSTVDNFGRNGAAPSHPELLDTLAVEFVESGWSVKRLVRRLVSSRTYGQSARFDRRAFERDPDDTLLWRARRKRLPAESIRDGLAAMSGDLELTADDLPGPGGGERLRTVFAPIVRNELSAFLTVFDFADPEMTTGRRSETNVPAQSLYLLNDPFVLKQTARIAERLARETGDEARQIDAAYRLILGRPAAAGEVARASDYLRRVAGDATSPKGAPAKTAAPDLEGLRRLVQALVASTEFRLLD